MENEEKLAAIRDTQGASAEKEARSSSRIGQFFLAVLEKTIRRVRLMFLRSENSFKVLADGIRKRRSIKSEERRDEVVSRENEQLDGIVEKVEKYAPEKKDLMEKMFLKRKRYQEEAEEKFFRPIISDRVVVPKRRREVKGRLEELLIERIAANPKDIEAYERLGEYYLEVKNLEHAKECFKQILRMNPTNSNVKYKMRKLERMLKG